MEDTEREKRDLMGVISRLKQESAERDGTSFFFLKDILRRRVVV